MLVLGTTISLAFTLVAAKLTEEHQRAKDRRLSAMMVMSNIENFARTLDARAERMAPTDSLATWLLSKPIEELEMMPEKELLDLVNKATTAAYLAHDKSAENIFSNNIETWKNMGNVQFIDLVGGCFSAMNSVEEQWNDWVKGVIETLHDVKSHPENYEGSRESIKCLQAQSVRKIMSDIHTRRGWLGYVAATIRYYNLKNMKAIGISEQEVMDYTAAREQKDDKAGAAPDAFQYYTDPISPENLTSLQYLDVRLEELKNGESGEQK